MDAVSDFFAMGGYAAFVWPAYAAFAIVLGGLLVQSLRSLQARRREIAALEAAAPRRRARAAGDTPP